MAPAFTILLSLALSHPAPQPPSRSELVEPIFQLQEEPLPDSAVPS